MNQDFLDFGKDFFGFFGARHPSNPFLIEEILIYTVLSAFTEAKKTLAKDWDDLEAAGITCPEMAKARLG